MSEKVEKIKEKISSPTSLVRVKRGINPVALTVFGILMVADALLYFYAGISWLTAAFAAVFSMFMSNTAKATPSG